MNYAMIASMSVALLLSTITPAIAEPTEEEIPYNNATLCTAYFEQAADGAKDAGDENAEYFGWMAKEFKGVAIFDGEQLGYKPELVDGHIFTMTMTLLTQMSVLTEDGFKKFDENINNHCIGAMPGLEEEHVAFVWPGNSSGVVK